MRRGTQSSWIWLIIFLPLIGCIAYMVLEMFNANKVNQIPTGISNVIYPSGTIKKLEKQLKFSDTFNNRILLADAYLSAGDTKQAIELYEKSLTGAFTENEHVLLQLVSAYYNEQRYSDVIKIGKKLYNNPVFIRSHAHVLYAMALERTGEAGRAEKEFTTMQIRYSYFEGRYQYAMFLLNAHRTEEAEKLLGVLVNEFSYLSAFEKRNNRIWFNKAKHELKKITSPVP